MWTIASTSYNKTYHSDPGTISHIFCVLMYILIFTLPIYFVNYQKSTPYTY